MSIALLSYFCIRSFINELEKFIDFSKFTPQLQQMLRDLPLGVLGRNSIPLRKQKSALCKKLLKQGRRVCRRLRQKKCTRSLLQRTLKCLSCRTHSPSIQLRGNIQLTSESSVLSSPSVASMIIYASTHTNLLWYIPTTSLSHISWLPTCMKESTVTGLIDCED